HGVRVALAARAAGAVVVADLRAGGDVGALLDRHRGVEGQHVERVVLTVAADGRGGERAGGGLRGGPALDLGVCQRAGGRPRAGRRGDGDAGGEAAARDPLVGAGLPVHGAGEADGVVLRQPVEVRAVDDGLVELGHGAGDRGADVLTPGDVDDLDVLDDGSA